MDQCEAADGCLNPINFIVDCDECKNIFVCNEHVGLVINNHAKQCEDTLHVDLVKETK